MALIKATEASRHFSDLLDRVERHGEEFDIERHGKLVARLTPAGPISATWAEVWARLMAGPRPDPEFAADLEAIRREEPPMTDEDPWERYSTRPS